MTEQNKRVIVIISAVVILIIVIGLMVYYRKRNKKNNLPELPSGTGAGQRPYIFEDKIKDNREQFITQVEALSKKIGVKTNDLLAVMYLESGLNAQAENKSYPFVNPPGFATGLIQFTPQTAISLGTTTAALKGMTNVQQLQYVEKYYNNFKGKLHNFTDLYMATFFPVALGWPDSATIQSNTISAALVAKNNPAFDLDKNNAITVGEFKTAILNKLPAQYRAQFK